MLLGWQVADRLGVPLVRAYIEPPAWLMTRRPARHVAPAVRQAVWLAARPWINGVRRRALDAPPVALREPFAVLDRAGSLFLYAFSPAVLPVPGAGKGACVTGYWFLEEDADPAPPPGLQAFLDAGPPPVSVGFGTMIDTDPGGTVALVAEALRQAGQRGVLIRGAHPTLTPLPPHLFAVDSISHAWLFPRCAAAVHYAPAGTTAAALRAGIPSVAVPQMPDQFQGARRLHELGVAPEPVARRQLTTEGLARAVRTAATDDGMRRRAAAIGDRIRAEDGVSTAARAFARHVPVPPPVPVT
jgi:UDP:flavonoid glycosyltransferase YjiC (YdhE family)